MLVEVQQEANKWVIIKSLCSSEFKLGSCNVCVFIFVKIGNFRTEVNNGTALLLINPPECSLSREKNKSDTSDTVGVFDNYDCTKSFPICD